MASGIPLRPDGAVYHLGLQPGQAAHRCLLVGDPGRLALVEPLLDQVLHRGGNREFVWITGLYGGVALTAIGTGIGIDNTEIAVIELDALQNIDLTRGQPFPTHKKMYFLRVGTSGLLQAERPLATVVFSRWAVSVDPYPIFYDFKPEPELTRALQHYWLEQTGQPLSWYGVQATEFFLRCAQNTPKLNLPWAEGITYTALGFYAPQGRCGRLSIRFPELPAQLAGFVYAGYKVENIEMETAALYLLAQRLGHEAGALCLGIAHRQTGEFIYQDGGISPQAAMQEVLRLALEWLRQAP
ncbi:MAG: phosphorylase [Bacteroidia bacterium]